MVVVKKSNESGGAPSLDILAAKLRVVEAEFFADPYEVNLTTAVRSRLIRT
jgi:hypothetical protein